MTDPESKEFMISQRSFHNQLMSISNEEATPMTRQPSFISANIVPCVFLHSIRGNEIQGRCTSLHRLALCIGEGIFPGDLRFLEAEMGVVNELEVD
jgi:hypothetical protein